MCGSSPGCEEEGLKAAASESEVSPKAVICVPMREALPCMGVPQMVFCG